MSDPASGPKQPSPTKGEDAEAIKRHEEIQLAAGNDAATAQRQAQATLLLLDSRLRLNREALKWMQHALSSQMNLAAVSVLTLGQSDISGLERELRDMHDAAGNLIARIQTLYGLPATPPAKLPLLSSITVDKANG